MSAGKLIYLASPYSSPDKDVVKRRVQATRWATANLMVNGFVVFSPICHTHEIAKCGLTTKRLDWWLGFDLEILRRCNELYILTLPGWKTSRGIWIEARDAREHSLPIWLTDGDGIWQDSSLRDFVEGENP